MSITVIIECTSPGAIGGYQELRVYPTDTVGSLIENYCSYKGVRRNADFALMTRDFLLRESIKTVAEAGVRDGDHLFLVSQGYPSKMAFNHWWILAAITLTIGVIGLSSITILYISAVYPPFDYAILFDAGSTHTNMFVYTWQGDKANGTGVVNQLDSCTLKGGIAEDFALSPKNVVPYIKQCLDKGIENIPTDRRSDSPVYLAATAGMRLLGLENPVAEKQILGNISALFENSSLKQMPRGVRTICGDEEALSGWVTVNYLSDTLTKARISQRTKREVFTPKTIGALDMGGASTQITYEVEPPNPPIKNFSDCGSGTKLLKLYGNTYYLYSRSFLCFGVKQMKNMYRTLLLEHQPINATNISSPCDNVGYSKTYSYESLDSYCSKTLNLPKFAGRSLTYYGTGNITECQGYIEKILNTTECKRVFLSGNCFEKPPPRTYNAAFSAFSSFEYMATGLNYTTDMGPEIFYNKTKEVCELTWDQVLANNYPGVTPNLFINLCFNSLYQYTILRNHYMITDDEWHKLNFSQQIDNNDVGWSLGYMINATNLIPEEEPISSILSLPSFILFGIFFVAFIALSAAASTIALQHTRVGNAKPLTLLRSSGESSERLTYGAIDA